MPRALDYAVIGNKSMLAVIAVTNRLAVIPHWALAIALIAIGGFAWVPTYRFSLRTLLVATTLVAALLGLIAWSMR